MVLYQMYHYLAFLCYFSTAFFTNGQLSGTVSFETNPYHYRGQRSSASKENLSRNYSDQEGSGQLQQQSANISSTGNEKNVVEICSMCDSLKVKNTLALPSWFYHYGIQEDIKTCGDLDKALTYFGIEKASENCSNLRLYAFYQCCDLPVPVYECTRRIRKSIVDGQDTMNPPITSDGLNITVGLRYQGVTSIDIQEGTATIFVTLKFKWNDPRLAWTIDANNCANDIYARASLDAESTEIWVPTYDLANRITGVNGMEEESALVYNDGTVSWVRQGSLKIFCQFTGLATFPYDTLGCRMALQPADSQFLMNVNYIQQNLDFGPLIKTSYNEYSIMREMCSNGQGSGKLSRVLYYDLYFSRAKNFYKSNIIYPTIILTYLSFFAFIINFRVSDRISFGVALTLVIVAQKIIASDRIPISREKFWMNQLIAWSFFWNVFVVVESVFSAFVFSLQENAGKSEEEGIEKEKKIAEEIIEDYSEYDADSCLECNKNGRVGEKEMKKIASFKKRSKAKSESRGWILSFPIKAVDHICALLCFVSYSCFLIWMYTTRSQWVYNDQPFQYP